jgi:hypothetical protein
MNKIKRSIKLMKAAFAVLFREKKLLLFPIIGTGLALVVALFFIAPILLYPDGHPVFSAAHWSSLGHRFTYWFNLAHAQNQSGQPTGVTPMNMVYPLVGHPLTVTFFALAYFVSMFLTTFTNVAFYHEILQALNGQPVSIRRGYRVALARWRAILFWSLFAGAVGYLVQAIEQRVGFLGRIIAGFIGMAWSISCVFIIPTLVRDVETTNPVKLLRHSADTLKRTCGELVVGFVGLQLLFVLIVAPLIFAIFLVLWGLGHYLHLGSALKGIGIAMVTFGVFFLITLAMSWFRNMTMSLYRCALYIYATEGVIPDTFDKELLDSAWKVK